MGIEVEMEGSGELGDIVPGWSVQEYATPITIGDTAGGTGQVSFSAGAKPDSLFVVNNKIATTDVELGTVNGIVKSVSQTGLNVSVTHNTQLSIFDASFDIPALGAGGMLPVLDLASQLSERDKMLKLDSGYYSSLRGHAACFGSSGSLFEPEVNDGSYQILTTGTSTTFTLPVTTTAGSATVTTTTTAGLVAGVTISGNANIPAGRTVATIVNLTTFTLNSGTSVTAGTNVATTFTKTISPYYYPVYFRETYGSIWADSYTVANNDVWATNIIGDCFSNNKAINTSRLAFKTRLSSTPTVWTFAARPNDLNIGSGQDITLTLDGTTNTATLLGRYNAGGVITDFQQQLNIASTLAHPAEEIAVFIQYLRPLTGNTYSIRVRVCNTSNYTVYGEIYQTFNTDASYYFMPWTLTGKARALYRDRGSALSTWVPEEYENDKTYSVSADIVLDGPVAAQAKSNLWEYMQAACAAYNFEIAAVADTVVARDIDQTEIDVDNHTPITITPTMTLTGRSVEVVYSNAKHVSNAELYDAYADDNRVISVKSAETITTTVNVDGTLASLNVPTGTTSLTLPEGAFYVSDSDGKQVPLTLFAQYGGRVDVAINADNSSAIDITLYGPTSSDGIFNESTSNGVTVQALYPDPYKLAYTADGTDYAALSITGTGILFNEKTAKIQTAADQTKTAQDVAKTIKNPFINTKEMAYNRALNATIDASGPKVTITGTVPVSSLAGFGLAAGSRIRYSDSIYRVMDVTIGNLGANFTATRHVTAEDFDTFWAGKPISTHDTLWSGYDAADHQIKPLWFIGDDEPIVMLLDVDGNPYYEFLGIPEISVYFDTDGNPFYETGYEDNSQPVYLDTDGNPFVED